MIFVKVIMTQKKTTQSTNVDAVDYGRSETVEWKSFDSVRNNLKCSSCPPSLRIYPYLASADGQVATKEFK